MPGPDLETPLLAEALRREGVAAQIAVWRDLMMGTSKWQPLLTINYFTPYLIGYGCGLILSLVMSVSAALKTMLSVSFLGFVLASVLLRRRFGGDRRLDWLFIPGFFGYSYLWGFYTFLVAAPVGLLFVLLAHRYADRPTRGRGAVLFFANLALFFCHGLVFVFAGIMVSLPQGPGKWRDLLAALLVTCMALIFDWVAFGPGERQFTGSVNGFGYVPSELSGRVAFGIAAIIFDIFAILMWVQQCRRALGWSTRTAPFNQPPSSD